MKVKVGDTIYDSDDVPIMLDLDSEDKENISNMMPSQYKYARFPESFSNIEDKENWMQGIYPTFICENNRCYTGMNATTIVKGHHFCSKCAEDLVD